MALHYSCLNGNVKITKLLLKHGATFSRNKAGETPLTMAVYNNREELVNYLLEIPDFSCDDRADALELLGATILSFSANADLEKVLEPWYRAMKERHRPGRPVARKREHKLVGCCVFLYILILCQSSMVFHASPAIHP
jgi:hypothetical protein